MTKQIRVSQDTYDKISQLIDDYGGSHQSVLEEAIERSYRERFEKDNKVQKTLKGDKG